MGGAQCSQIPGELVTNGIRVSMGDQQFWGCWRWRTAVSVLGATELVLSGYGGEFHVRSISPHTKAVSIILFLPPTFSTHRHSKSPHKSWDLGVTPRFLPFHLPYNHAIGKPCLCCLPTRLQHPPTPRAPPDPSCPAVSPLPGLLPPVLHQQPEQATDLLSICLPSVPSIESKQLALQPGQPIL